MNPKVSPLEQFFFLEGKRKGDTYDSPEYTFVWGIFKTLYYNILFHLNF